MTRYTLPAHKQNSLIIFQVVITATLAVFLSAIPTAGQSSGRPQEQKPSQSENTTDANLINPDRPGIADGSNVIGVKRLQIETGLQEEFRRDGDSREHTIFIPTLIPSALIITGRLGLRETLLPGSPLSTQRVSRLKARDSRLSPLASSITSTTSKGRTKPLWER